MYVLYILYVYIHKYIIISKYNVQYSIYKCTNILYLYTRYGYTKMSCFVVFKYKAHT